MRLRHRYRVSASPWLGEVVASKKRHVAPIGDCYGHGRSVTPCIKVVDGGSPKATAFNGSHVLVYIWLDHLELGQLTTETRFIKAVGRIRVADRLVGSLIQTKSAPEFTVCRDPKINSIGTRNRRLGSIFT